MQENNKLAKGIPWTWEMLKEKICPFECYYMPILTYAAET
jgi:hypothetical protein